MTLYNQLFLFFTMAVTGMSLGVIYDGYREWLNRGAKKKWLQAIVDIFLWILGAAIVFFVSQWGSQGVMRIYVVMALIVGLWAYLKLFSRLFRYVWKHLFQIWYAILDFFVLKWWRILTRQKKR